MINNVENITDNAKFDIDLEEILKEEIIKEYNCYKCDFSYKVDINEYNSDDEELNEICSDKNVKEYKPYNCQICKCGSSMYYVIYTITTTKEN